MLQVRQIGTKLLCRNSILSIASYSTESKDIVETEDNQNQSALEKWKNREQFTKKSLQRFEQLPVKNYYAPDWELNQYDDNDKLIKPRYNNITTPEKWEYYNKVF